MAFSFSTKILVSKSSVVLPRKTENFILETIAKSMSNVIKRLSKHPIILQNFD